MMRKLLSQHVLSLAAALALLVAGTPVRAADEAKPAQPRKIDIVLCLDVSGSMNGLIASAKAKLWDIVNELARIQPAPELRVGLYSYGNDGYDPKAGWVRKEVDLTIDLDEIYRTLNGLTINGGSEYVARVTRDAIEQQRWSEDPAALKIIFVCGNEPAGQDPQVTLKSVADKALAKGVVVNCIFCGPANHPDSQDWREYASLAKGQFFSIDQDRGTVVIATPFDKELAELSNKLSTTYVCYGKDGWAKQQNQVAQDANATKAGSGAAAARANSKATGLYRCDAWDLVDRMKNDPKFDVKKVPVEDLPEEMKKMTPEEREAHVKKKAAEREAMQKKIAELNAKRQTYIQAELKKNPTKGDQAFDAAVRGALRAQAASKGIVVPE